jgi:hypothetical protein
MLSVNEMEVGVSNLRSDSRALVKRLPDGDLYKVHVERLCHQIDHIEDQWHAAERRLKLWKWTTGMRFIVQEEASDNGPSWVVADVDNVVVGRGPSPEEAIIDAMSRIEEWLNKSFPTIPTTPEEVAVAEAEMQGQDIQLPESLRNPLDILRRRGLAQ